MSLLEQHDRGDEVKIAHTNFEDRPSMLILKTPGWHVWSCRKDIIAHTIIGITTSWGKEVSVKKFIALFDEYCEPIQQLLSLVTRVKRLDYFGGRRLDSVVRHGPVTLLGDASHPLSGAFGAGAAFAMEDAHVLAGAIRWAASSSLGLDDALRVFDDVRSAHYRNLYQTLDDVAVAHKKTFTEASSVH